MYVYIYIYMYITISKDENRVTDMCFIAHILTTD